MILEHQNKKIFLLIPAYNEERKIGQVIDSLKKSGYHDILVIDDGSKDKTAEYAKNSGAEILRHIINRGQGASLRTGIEYLREEYNPDIIVTFDADGQHRVEDIALLLKPVIDNEFDIALGSRFLCKKCHMTPMRKLILKAGIIFTRLISRINLTDTHNGFRALGRKAIDSIKISHRGMEHASDIIDEISVKKLKYKEVPTEIIYSKYSIQKGTNKNIDFIKMGIKIILNKILS
ncbi:MAG: glycosyltransferase family 2 protein [Candidatus Moranbacteria bacterium]|jgi:glycosyltransferase involved in cell wall biosynthesis|nr:glycosyltransferase family 2 protein [Candidatus Moranbacteria bacterium]